MTKTYFFNGVAKWAKTQKVGKFGNYEVDAYLSDWDEFDNSGLQLKKKTDDDGGVFVRFRRPEKQEIKGDIVERGPPDVKLFAGTNPENGEDMWEDFDGAVGNGSECVFKVVVYDTKLKGKGHRLEAIGVKKLVEYIPGEDQSEFPF